MAWGCNGAVASAHQAASLAGLDVLRSGGNAVDAAVATSAVLNVVEPAMSGVGGFGSFMTIYSAQERRTRVLDSMGTSPTAAEPRLFTERDFDEGYKAPVVPGVVAGWAEALSAYGTSPLSDLLEPAIRLAYDGIAVSGYQAMWFKAHARRFASFPGSARVFLPDGRPPEAGERFRQLDLAQSLRSIAEHGSEILYHGSLGASIVSDLQRHDGILTESDLASFRVAWRDPIECRFRDLTLYSVPPGSTAMTMFQILNIVEDLNIGSFDQYDPASLHLFIEAVKLAMEDDHRYNTGKAVDIPVQRLISKEHAREQRARITSDVRGVQHPLADVGSTHISVADTFGNVVAFTTSLSGGFGSAVVAEGTGVLLNNGHRIGFVLDEGDINFLDGGQRAKGIMSPTIALRDGVPVLAIGAAGGYTIPQTIAQVLMATTLFGLDLQQAIASPRFALRGVMGRVPSGDAHMLSIDRTFPSDTLSSLERAGHIFEQPDTGNTGSVQGVQIVPATKIVGAASDPRREGYGLAY
jgi:gamma-glutamyltranspeptidase/glutathione hydrolase